nr:DUF362 domain-containing protein [Enterocloster citroniae]
MSKRKWMTVPFLLLLLAGLVSGCGDAQSSQSAQPSPEIRQETEGEETSKTEGASEMDDGSKAEGTNPAEGTLTTNGGAVIPLSALGHYTGDEDAPVVYYISDITPDALVRIYEALNWTPSGSVAVKLSTGEPPASNYLRPELIADLVQKVDGTIVECNTAYGGSRASAAMHYQVAEDHGFTEIADFQILDEDGSMTLPVEGGAVLSENYVGAAFADYDDYLILSHFKGHAMAGYGGAIKNISIGLGSSEGKAWIHSGGTSRTNAWGGEQDAFLEAMADAGKSVSDYLGGGERIVYINVMNRLSIDCDCDGNPAEPDMHDIGILASTDPVALDQACIDLVWVSEENESLVNRVESRNGLHTLESAEEVGLGVRNYRLVDISQ